ncbi:hypothetical protein ABRZ04_01825 [Castellaniella ginsengisoli]|jgi:hypothetical protein|uniref:Uncharacterized protein n=1 Tax=Castellaniella ginsengisoli TaxID=546114 RepID=A0AB39D1C4_9BURK
MLAPFSNFPVNEAFERLMAEERAARVAQPHASLMRRILNALFGSRCAAAHA